MLVWLYVFAMGSRSLISSGHGATVPICDLSKEKNQFLKTSSVPGGRISNATPA